ncbi:MAG: hypothetical protein M4579_002072, partial [Chaenotheca gracillima]
MFMKTTLAAAAASLLAGASASPHLAPHFVARQDSWSPAGPDDSRAPCPGLNTLANHGLLPHDGRNITVEMTVAAFKTGFNMGSDVITTAATNAVNLGPSGSTTFDLANLNKPHAIEHDASLSREDYNTGLGDNHHFNGGIWQTVLDLWGDCNVIDFTRANAARMMRINSVKQSDQPGWFSENDGGSLTEHSFFLSTMGDPVKGNARKDWINYWISNERFPFALGWSPTDRPETNQGTINNMIPKIQNAGTSISTCSGGPASTSKAASSTKKASSTAKASSTKAASTTAAGSTSSPGGGYGGGPASTSKAGPSSSASPSAPATSVPYSNSTTSGAQTTSKGSSGTAPASSSVPHSTGTAPISSSKPVSSSSAPASSTKPASPTKPASSSVPGYPIIP